MAIVAVVITKIHNVAPGVPKQGGMGEYISPNDLNECTVHLSENWGKSVLFLMKTFFFWSSPEFGEKKCSI